MKPEKQERAVVNGHFAPGSTTPSEILGLTDTLRHHMNSGIHTKSATLQYSAPPHRVSRCRAES